MFFENYETFSSVSSLNLMNNQHKLGGCGHCFKPVMPKIQNFYFFKNGSKILKTSKIVLHFSGNFKGLSNGILFVFIVCVVLELFKITQSP